MEDETLPTKKISIQKEKNFLIQKIEGGQHAVALCSGQYVPNGFANFTAKYSKFAYSSKYAFSVSRGYETLKGGAFDSMLALRADGDSLFHVRERNVIREFNERYILSEWNPYSDVNIKTFLIPCGEFHIRLHRIDSRRKLYAAEGGFSIRRWEKDLDKTIECNSDKAFVSTTEDMSIVLNLLGYQRGITVLSENTNLHYPRSVLPVLEGEVKEGDNIFACAVFAGSNNSYNQEIIKQVPKLKYEGGQICIMFACAEFLTIDLRR